MKLKSAILASFLFFSLSWGTGGGSPAIYVGLAAGAIILCDIPSTMLVKITGDAVTDRTGPILIPYLCGLAGGGLGTIAGIALGTQKRTMTFGENGVMTQITVSKPIVYAGCFLGLLTGNVIGYALGPSKPTSKTSLHIYPAYSREHYAINISKTF